MKRFLVTGGAGFIGNHLCKKLLLKGEVTVVDDFSRGVRRKANGLRLEELDITREVDRLKIIMEDHDVVFNLAALNTGVDFDVGRTNKMFEQNFLLQTIPLKIAAELKNVKKFFQISSASVYRREDMEKGFLGEESLTNDPEPSKEGYAWAKIMGEKQTQWFVKDKQLKAVIVRPINVYGPGDHFDDKGHFIPVIVRKFLEAEKRIEVYGSGKQKRSFVYIDDLVEALMLLLQKGGVGEVYNIDSGREFEISGVVKKIQNITKKNEIEVVYNKLKPEGSKRRILKTDKIRRLGWKPRVKFSDGLEKVVSDVEKRLFANEK